MTRRFKGFGFVPVALAISAFAIPVFGCSSGGGGAGGGTGGCSQCAPSQDINPKQPMKSCSMPADCGIPPSVMYQTCHCTDAPSVGCVHYSTPACANQLCTWTEMRDTNGGMNCGGTTSSSSASSGSTSSSGTGG